MVKNPPAGAGDAGDMGSKEIATRSSILAWRIPWTGSLVGYSPSGCNRVRHDLVTNGNV